MKSIDTEKIIRAKLSKARASPFKAYKDLMVGPAGLRHFILHELLMLFLSPMPGALGILLRQKLYPLLFKKAGRGLIIGRNVVFRHPARIELHDNVTIDDNSLIDGRGAGEAGVVLEEGVLINRNCMIQAKDGPIRLGSRTSIGCNSVIISLAGVELGQAVLASGNIYISPGAYHTQDLSMPIMDQGVYSKGPIKIGDHAWIGTGATILDGVSIGKGAVIGACTLVTKEVPENAVVAGVPAKVIRIRKGVPETDVA